MSRLTAERIREAADLASVTDSEQDLLRTAALRFADLRDEYRVFDSEGRSFWGSYRTEEEARAYVEWVDGERIAHMTQRADEEGEKEKAAGRISTNLDRNALKEALAQIPHKVYRRKVSEWELVE